MFDDVIALLHGSPPFFYLCVALLGVCVGSFLNVVAYRLPVIMEREWKRECHRFLELDEPTFEPAVAQLGLSRPGSSCPACGHAIRFWENIPLLSYLLILRGRCSGCHTRIALRYPLVELLTLIATVLVAQRFGVSMQTLAAMLFTWTLLALTLIDLDKQLLPDNITLPLLWLGLLCNLFGWFTDLQGSVIGAVAGYLVLWGVFHLFRLLTGKEGMGYGDFKLLAALGAWTGFALLPQIILVSSVLGSVTGITLIALKRNQRGQPIPFGPYLAAAGWIALLWGETINQHYLAFLP